MKSSLSDKNIDTLIDTLGRKQFRKEKKTWKKESLKEHALALIYGGTKSDGGDAFARWNRA